MPKFKSLNSLLSYINLAASAIIIALSPVNANGGIRKLIPFVDKPVPWLPASHGWHLPHQLKANWLTPYCSSAAIVLETNELTTTAWNEAARSSLFIGVLFGHTCDSDNNSRLEPEKLKFKLPSSSGFGRS